MNEPIPKYNSNGAILVMEEVSITRFKKSNLRISTMTVTAHWNSEIDLGVLFEQLIPYFIPIWYPDEGILKIEHKRLVYGTSYKDMFTNRKAATKSFFNQSTMVIRRRLGDDGWKEVNMKLFENGGIQMTGVISEEFAHDTIKWLLERIKLLAITPFKGEPTIVRLQVPLINTDYEIDHDIQQDALHRILVEDYDLFSTLEKTIYQGINTKYFYNKTNNGNGICNCSSFCKGQGTGNGEGECKRITMSIFRTGKIIITGARRMEQIISAYNFLNSILETHASEVLYARPSSAAVR